MAKLATESELRIARVIFTATGHSARELHSSKTMSSRISLACLGILVAITCSAEPDPVLLSARELAARLAAKQQDGNAYVRMRMEISGAAKTTMQLELKSRASRGGTEVVYRVLWPKERKGEAVLLRKIGSRPITGAIFSPSSGLRTLSGFQDRLFDGDLSYEDAVDNFFAWDQQEIVGTETVDRVNCQVLESKPGKGAHSSYSSVRSWIDPRRLVPLRVEKYGPSGKLLRRIDTSRIVTDDRQRTIPANFVVRGPGGSSVTDIDGARIRHGVNFSDEEFTPEGLKRGASAPATAE
jgi:hypothetical protein